MNTWIPRLAPVVIIAIVVGLAIANSARSHGDPACAGISSYDLEVGRAMQPYRHALDAMDFRHHPVNTWTRDQWRMIGEAADTSFTKVQTLSPPPGVAGWHTANMNSLMAMSIVGHAVAEQGLDAVSAHAAEIGATSQAMVKAEQAAMQACPAFTRGTAP